MDEIKLEQWKAKQEANIASWRAEFDAKLAQYHVESTHKLTWGTEMFKSVIAASQVALKSAILINGGASVALLAFIGNLWSKGISNSVMLSLSRVMCIFVLGVFAGALACGSMYLTQYCYEREWIKRGNYFRYSCVFLVITCYVLFFIGSAFAYFTFASHFGPMERC
jgi:hypothetical protein